MGIPKDEGIKDER
jgi:hypothetical protein